MANCNKIPFNTDKSRVIYLHLENQLNVNSFGGNTAASKNKRLECFHQSVSLSTAKRANATLRYINRNAGSGWGEVISLYLIVFCAQQTKSEVLC